jgi:UDP-N-acetylmuramoyl-L-alanyl-D-glutamate--2,6-diaminopimelate ligase
MFKPQPQYLRNQQHWSITMLNYTSYSLAQALAVFNIVIAEQDQALLASCQALVNDSRKLQRNDVFCAVIGEQQDGREYIEQAIEQGISVVLSECKQAQYHGDIIRTEMEKRTVLVIRFYQLNFHLFALCQHYYQYPQQQMTLIGVTGTNGKTSTCQIIAKLLEAEQQSCAILGTLGAGTVDALTPLTNTTPGATELHHYLTLFKSNHINNIAMEVSSHALSQRRITSEFIDIAVFTNLSRDHLDFHQTMAAYSAAKKQIFSASAKQIAILNNDDKQAQQWLANWPSNQPYFVYGRVDINAAKQHARYVVAEKIQHSQSGVSFNLLTHLGDVKIVSPLLADFNIDNLLAAIAVLLAKKPLADKEPLADKDSLTNEKTLADIAQTIASLTPIIGRMEAFSQAQQPTAVVDYAHTPDALENALLACKEHCLGKLWVVFGCGGDRDKGKRALMGQVAEKGADRIVITNDNPRSEPPELIANDILLGCQQSEKIIVMLDRKQAVLSTLAKASADDLVLFAGKGHENTITIGNQQFDYNERATVKSFYQQANTKHSNKPLRNKEAQ